MSRGSGAARDVGAVCNAGAVHDAGTANAAPGGRLATGASPPRAACRTATRTSVRCPSAADAGVGLRAPPHRARLAPPLDFKALHCLSYERLDGLESSVAWPGREPPGLRWKAWTCQC